MQAPRFAQGFGLTPFARHAIATPNHGGRWLVYLDHVLQQRKHLETPEAAVNCLQHIVEKAQRALGLH